MRLRQLAGRGSIILVTYLNCTFRLGTLHLGLSHKGSHLFGFFP